MILKEAECNNKCKSNWDVTITRIQQQLQHKASYQCRKCRHEVVQSHQRTHLKGHLKTGRKKLGTKFYRESIKSSLPKVSSHTFDRMYTAPTSQTRMLCIYTESLDEEAKLSSCAPGTWETKAATLNMKSAQYQSHI